MSTNVTKKFFSPHAHCPIIHKHYIYILKFLIFFPFLPPPLPPLSIYSWGLELEWEFFRHEFGFYHGFLHKFIKFFHPKCPSRISYKCKKWTHLLRFSLQALMFAKLRLVCPDIHLCSAILSARNGWMFGGIWPTFDYSTMDWSSPCPLCSVM